ncbi:hypothetical protein HOLleu_19727 [Holothuria leucospilota]|uniref:Uncharacterized protein n=1 Tax=Holothuria leucospilota TaxID=206669 RepID=A0A9Q1BZP3_HOLLE|nr:hypothetical protein HOLleu_19727 [Holothuria leucospilota]
MQPSGQQQALWGNHGYPVVSPVPPTTRSSSDGNLWGSSVRRAMGIIQIISGVIEFALGIALVSLPLRYFYHDNVAWGIWNGVFAVVTGCIGVYSKRSKCMVIAYMVLSIIAAVMSGACCISTSSVTPYLGYQHNSQKYSDYWYYGWRYDYDRGYMYATAHYAIYIVLDIVFALQMLISIIGASFTCGALYSSSNQQQVMFQINPQVASQPFGPAPPYTSVATQSQPPTVSFNSLQQPAFHQTGMIGTTSNPTNQAQTNTMGVIATNKAPN